MSDRFKNINDLDSASLEELLLLTKEQAMKLAKKGIVVDQESDEYETIETGFYEVITNKFGRIVRENPNFSEFAKYFIDEYNAVSDEAGLWIFRNGRYECCSKQLGHNIVNTLTLGRVKPYHLNHFIEKVKAQAYISERFFAPTDGKINLSNGVLNIETGELEPNSPKYFFKYQLPHKYDPDARCPEFMKFLDRVLMGSPKLINLMGEIFGYCLEGNDPWLHRAFVFIGEGRNGKSTLLNILRALIGYENCANVSLAYLDKPFSVVSLDGKIANILEETPNGKINAEIFKTAVAGGELRAAQKGQPEFSLKCNAKFVFACNEMPIISETSVGVKDRLVFIPFDHYIAEGDRDPRILKKLMTEMPGILNWALSGLNRLRQRGGLSWAPETHDMIEQFKAENDSVYEWTGNRIAAANDQSFISTEILYGNYKTWCVETGRHPVSEQKFTKRFLRHIKSVSDEADRYRTNSERGFRGVKLKSELH